MLNKPRKLYASLFPLIALIPRSSSFVSFICKPILRGLKANAQQAMHQGVVRDMEQQRIKKERQLDFEMQRALEEEYRKVQSVRDGGEIVDKPR